MTPFLYLPVHPPTPSAAKNTSTDYIGVHIGRRELTGEAGQLRELIEKLSQLSCEQVLGSATFIGSLFDYRHRHTYAEQCGIANSVFSENTLQKLKDRWNDSTRRNEVVFHRQQLWFVIQLAVICCSNKSPEVAIEQQVRQELGECLLIANDIIGDQLTRKNTEDRKSQSTEWFMATSFLSLLELHWHSTGTVCPTRAISIWSEMQSHPRNQGAIDSLLGGISPNTAFQNAYGVSLDDYLQFVAALHFTFEGQNDEKKPLRVEKDLLSVLGDDQIISNCLKLLSRSPDELASDLIFRARQSWAVDFAPLRQFPILQLKNDKYVCPDLQLLEYYFDDTLYRSIVAAYSSTEHIQQYYGELFEQHINKVIAAFADHGPILAKQFLTNSKFEDKAQVSDAILDWPQVLVLVEYKATKLTPYQKYGGNPDALLKGIDDAYAKTKDNERKGAMQLAHSACRILSGDTVATCSPIASRKILPILVLAEQGLAIEFFRKRLDQKMRAAIDGAHHSRILPLILLSHYDVEAIETYVGHVSAESILRAYAATLEANPPNLLDSFGAFVQRTYGNVAPSSPIYMHALRMNQIDIMAKKLGVPTHAKKN